MIFFYYIDKKEKSIFPLMVKKIIVKNIDKFVRYSFFLLKVMYFFFIFLKLSNKNSSK